MKRHIFLPILVSFISALAIFVQFKLSKQNTYGIEYHSIIKRLKSKIG